MAGSSGEVDLENQETVPPSAMDHGGGWVTSPLNAGRSFYSQLLLVKPSSRSADDKNEERELTRTTHVAPASPRVNVSEEVSSLSVEDDSTITNTAPVSDQVNIKIDDDITTRIANDEAKIRHEKISKIVKEKDLPTLREFGGIKGTAEALGTDLQKGIPGDEQDLHDRRSAVGSTIQAPTPSFFKLLLQSFDLTVFLLLVCAVLSTGFGIQQEGPDNGWLEGAFAMFANIVLVVLRTMCKYFSVSHPRNSQMEVEVRRGGNSLHVSPSDLVPGDIVCLASGSLVPADGLFVSTAESSLLVDQNGMEYPTVDDNNPFLVHGATVVNGNGRMLVTCVGMKTTLGELMDQVRCNPNQYHLPAQLDKFTTGLQNVGLLITIFMIIVLIIRSVVLKDNEYPGLQGDQLKGKATAIKELINVIGRFFMKSSAQISVLVTYLPMLIVGLSELPFSVALAINYWTKTTLSGKANAHGIVACFTMGAVSTLCIGGGGLTLDPVLEVNVSHDADHQIISTECVAGIDNHVRQALYKGISTSCLTEQQFLLQWAKSNLDTDNENLLKNFTIEDSRRKLIADEEASGVVTKDETGSMWLYWSGPATIILSMCSEYYDSKGTTKLMDEQKRRDFEETIRNMRLKHLKTIAFAYKKTDALMLEEDNSLILIGVMGLLGVKRCIETAEALKILRKAGVDIIQFPEDEPVLLEGETPIYGMGRPLEKLNKVQGLKDKGHVVAMVGARTNETPALKEADVGIAMGTGISQMAGEGSDLIIHDDSLSSLVTSIRTGRCIHYNIQKYIQVEFTMNITLLVTISVTTMFLGHSTLGPIQIVWAHMLVTTLCGLALLVEPSNEEQMEKPPVKQTESLISKAMWRNIVLQASYQAAILVAFQFKWKALPGFTEKIMESTLFSCCVLCQVFSQISSREPEKKNIFRGILRTPWLWVAVGLSITMQVAFVEIGHKVAGNARLNWEQWGVCLLISMVSWPIDLAGKCAWDVIMKIRLQGYDTGSTIMRSSAVPESDSDGES